MSETAPVRSERNGDCLVLTLDRPDRLNALSTAMLAALKDELDRAADPRAGVRALVLTGAGRGFSSGADLAENPAGAPIDLSATLRERYAPVIERLVSLPFPVVAAVNGVAAGAGMSLALACDFILAARSAYFLQAFVNIGLVPDAGSTWFLPRLVGPQRARRLMMLGERLEAERAHEWGLVHEVVEDDALMARAREFAGTLAEGPTRALAGIRTLMRQSLDSDLPAQLEHEAVVQGMMGRTRDFLEGVTAFLQKRTPRFRGE